MHVSKESSQFLIFDAADPVTCHIPNTKDAYVGWGENDSQYLMPQMLCGILYRNGCAYVAKSGAIAEIYYNESGQHAVAGAKSNDGSDLMQITTPVATNDIKKVFTIKSTQNFKVLSGEHSLVNIHMKLSAFGEKYGTNLSAGGFGGYKDYKTYFQNGNIDNGSVHISVKVGDLYLHHTEGTASSLSDIKASWSTEEGYITCGVADGVPVYNYLRDDDDARTAVFTDDPGILIAIPDSLRNKSVPIEIGIWSGILNLKKWSNGGVSHYGVLTNEQGNDFDATYIDLIVTNFKISIAYEGGTQTIGTDLDQNVYIVPNDNASTYKYDVSSTITTRRGIQHGTGLALNDDLSYCATTYDLDGCKRRAAMVAKNREMLTVAVENNTVIEPFDTIAWHGKTYSPLADNIDWHDNENELKLINID